MLFSYAYYLQLIDMLRQHIPLVDYADVTDKSMTFFLLRHDVEFSVEKAFELAKLEQKELKIKSSYFFQLRNNTYNALSSENIRLIQSIHAMGHSIGLHVNCSIRSGLEDIAAFIQRDVRILEENIACPINRFSFHRPTHELLKMNLCIPNLINVYDKRFFQLDEPDGQKNNLRRVYYFSDSEHVWKYGNPFSILDKPNKKLQLLIHPYSWSKKGLENVANFKALIQEKYLTMLRSMQCECHHFPDELYHDKKI